MCLLVLLIQPVSAQGIETNGHHQEGDDKFLLNVKHIFIGTIEVSQMDLKYSQKSQDLRNILFYFIFISLLQRCISITMQMANLYE